MADIKAIAESLCGMTDKETEKIAAVLKEEYGIEPARDMNRRPTKYDPKRNDKPRQEMPKLHLLDSERWRILPAET